MSAKEVEGVALRIKVTTKMEGFLVHPDRESRNL